MVWKLTKKAEGMEPLPGVPWRDMEDDEFREMAKMYASQGWPDRSLHTSGFFEHDTSADKATKPAEKEA